MYWVQYMIYNKLVRDLIPDIIALDGKSAITRMLSDDEFKTELDNKLLEEVGEYLESNDIEEIADILEVLMAIIKLKGFSYIDVENVMKEKANKRGGFMKKIYLEEVKEI